MVIYDWLHNVAVAFDQFCNTIFRGLPDSTISARAATAKRDGKVWGCVLCKVLGWLNPGHCERSLANDVKRAEAAISDLEAK